MGTIVNANPTKEFFISMLSRNVDNKAAILELIDNSIDGAKRLHLDLNIYISNMKKYAGINFKDNNYLFGFSPLSVVCCVLPQRKDVIK